MPELTDEVVDEWMNAIGDNSAATRMLTSAIKKGAKDASDGLGSLGSAAEDSADSFDEMNDQVRTTTDELTAFEETAEKLQSAWKDVKTQASAVTRAFANTTKEIMSSGESFGVMRNFIDPLADGMGMVIKAFGETTAGVIGLGAAIPLVGGGFDSLAATIRGLSKVAAEVVTKLVKFGANLVIDGIEQLWSMFEGAASAGVLFANGMTEMNKQRGDLSLTTQEYTNVIKNQREQLSIFGGSVAEGAKRLAAVGKESQGFTQELRAMGITYAEQAENTSEFMATLQRSGQLQLMTDKQIAIASTEYQKNLVVMSSLTGKSVDTMKQERDEALKNMAFQAKLAKMDPAVRAEMEKALLSMPAGMKQAFQESVIFGKVMTDTGAIVSGASTYIEKFANSVADGTATNAEAFQTFRDELKENAPQLRKNLGDLAAAGMAELLGQGNAVTGSINRFADAFYKEISRAEGTLPDSVDKLLSVGAKQDQATKDILKGLDSQRDMQNEMLKIIKDQAMPAATEMFKLISGKMNTGLKEFVSYIENPDEYIKNQKKKITEKVKSSLGVDGVLDSILTALLMSDAEHEVKAAEVLTEKFGTPAEIRREENLAKVKESPQKTIWEAQAVRLQLNKVQDEKYLAGGVTRRDNGADDKVPTRDAQIEALTKLMVALEAKTAADRDGNKELAETMKAQLVEQKKQVAEQTKLVREFQATQ